MSTQKWGSLSLHNNSYLELFDATDSHSIKLQSASSIGANVTLTLPDLTDFLVSRTSTDTLTNKTLTSPAVTNLTGSLNGATGTLADITGFGLRDTSAAFDMTIAATSSVTLTTGRTLTVDVENGNRTLALSGNLTMAGGGPLTLTTTGSTNITLPTSGTLMTNPMTTAGDIIYGGASGVPTRLAAGSSTQLLHGGTTPSWSAVSLTADVTGTLPVANGGTGAATLAANNVLLGNGTSALQVVAPGTSGNVLTSNGTTWTSSAAAASPVSKFKYEWVTADTATVAITHSLGTKDVMVEVYDVSTGDTILIDVVERTSTSVLTLTASSAPPATDWRVLILALT